MTDTDTKKLLDEQFAQLPKAVQRAITGANVSDHLRKLADTNQLHLDQWQELETEVMMTLMGIKAVAALEQNIKKHVQVDDATAAKLAQDISTTVFGPIREELERFLSHPDAQVKEGEPIKDMTAEILKSASAPATPAPAPDTPAQPTVVRTEAPAAYQPGQPSSARKDIHADPYREAPDA